MNKEFSLAATFSVIVVCGVRPIVSAHDRPIDVLVKILEVV